MTGSNAQRWTPVNAPILTDFGESINPKKVLQEHPRPQMVREDWKNLNGLWDYAITPKSSTAIPDPQGKILVPFCLEAPLSGVQKHLKTDEYLWYFNQFSIPGKWKKKKVLLHFGAVDWECEVWVNDELVGTHQGGYIPFNFDITGAIKPGGKQSLRVRVSDPRGGIFTSNGKQANNTIFYETVSGIWQTVWLEPVPEVSIESLKIEPDVDKGQAGISAVLSGDSKGYELKVVALENEDPILENWGEAGETVMLKLDNPRLWSPESPFLYGLEVSLMKNERMVDKVSGYFGMRKIHVEKLDGFNKILLNNEEVFQYGPLDQSYWPGSVLTPPSDEAISWEIGYLKDIGINMVRLHITSNPDRWYYHCDRMGLLVWQDFVCARGRGIINEASSKRWVEEQKSMVDALYNHPSIVMWVLFNESWGQHKTSQLTDLFMEYDPTRLFSVASGWNDLENAGHIRDVHDYTFHPSIPIGSEEPHRAVLLGECGGQNVIVGPNNWSRKPYSEYETPKKGDRRYQWGNGMSPGALMDEETVVEMKRGTFTQGENFAVRYEEFIDGIRMLKNEGLCGAVFTQMTDMKNEQNGFLSFDRKVSKMDESRFRGIHEKLYTDPPGEKPVIHAYSGKAEIWKFEMQEPAEGWTHPDFDDSGWRTGQAPFGNTSDYEYHTAWNTEALYLRKNFHLDKVPDQLALKTYIYGFMYREISTLQVYLNGELIKSTLDRNRNQELRTSTILLSGKAMELLKAGENSIAIEADFSQVPSRFLDIGLIKISETSF